MRRVVRCHCQESLSCGYIVLEFFVVFVVGERVALLVAKHESLDVEERVHFVLKVTVVWQLNQRL